MIKLDPSIIGLWFLGGPANRDWMAALNRLDDGRLRLVYRFRYYDPTDPGNDAHSGKDTKTWFETVTADPITDEAAIQEHIEKVGALPVGLIGAGFQPVEGSKIYKLINTGDFEAFYKAFMKLPFVHAREATPEERAEFEREQRGGQA